MSQRRMFSPDIICSEEFIDMPVSARDLYYQLSIRADDDGFIQPRIIMKMIGASQDDLKILLAKRFLLHFDNGVVVIKHWLIHNMIRLDRYKETRFMEEKKTLFIKGNKAYTDNTENGKPLMATKWQPNDNQRLPQVRLGKVRLGKVNKEDVAIATFSQCLADAKPEESRTEQIAETAEWDFKKYLEDLENQPRRDLSIIALYWKFKKFNFTNKKQTEIEIRRSLRAAKDLSPFEDEKIWKTMEWLSKNADFKWVLESVGKYITENLLSLKIKK